MAQRRLTYTVLVGAMPATLFLMVNIMKTGASWHAGQLKSWASESVVYRRGSHTVTVKAAFGETRHDIVNPGGFQIEVHSRDFLIDVADLILNSVLVKPERGDEIEFTDTDGTRYTHSLMQLGNEPSWRYSDPHRIKYRIHTDRVKLPT